MRQRSGNGLSNLSCFTPALDWWDSSADHQPVGSSALKFLLYSTSTLKHENSGHCYKRTRPFPLSRVGGLVIVFHLPAFLQHQLTATYPTYKSSKPNMGWRSSGERVYLRDHSLRVKKLLHFFRRPCYSEVMLGGTTLHTRHFH